MYKNYASETYQVKILGKNEHDISLCPLFVKYWT